MVRNVIWILILLALIPFILFVKGIDWILFGSEKDRIKEDYGHL